MINEYFIIIFALNGVVPINFIAGVLLGIHLKMIRAADSGQKLNFEDSDQPKLMASKLEGWIT